MSHFFTVVIVPKDAEDIETKIATLLAPYDENLKVDEYEVDCYCVNRKARNKAVEATNSEFGPISEARDKFSAGGILKEERERYEFLGGYWGRNKGPALTEEELDEHHQLSVLLESAWKSYIKPRQDFQMKFEESHPLHNKPNEDCDECEGSGIAKTRYSPNSKWDWWRVGGRWDQTLLGGKSNGDGFNFGGQHERLSGNTASTNEWLAYLKRLKDRESPCFAVVTPEGEWIQRGEMGWWAITTNEKETASWKAQVEGIAASYPDHIAVGCDLHI